MKKIKVIKEASIAEVKKKSKKAIEAEKKAAEEYENKIISTLNSLGLSGNIKKGAGSSRYGADADMQIDGEIYKIEVKMNDRTQMGGTSVRYNPTLPDIEKFSIVSKEVDEDTCDLIEEALFTRQEEINNLLDYLNVPVFPLTIPVDEWERAKNDNILKPLNAKISGDTTFISDHYSSKEVNYIQLGGSGLFYLRDNPANLPIPKLEGEIKIELRPGAGGSRYRKKDDTRVRSVGIRAQGRLQFKGQSPYSLDNPDSIKEMLNQRENLKGNE